MPTCDVAADKQADRREENRRGTPSIVRLNTGLCCVTFPGERDRLRYVLTRPLYIFFLIDLGLSCVCVVIGTTCNIHVVVFLGWQAV